MDEATIANSYKVDVDTEVWELLRGHAEPFVDTPNSVLRRLLGIDLKGRQSLAPKPATAPTADATRTPKPARAEAQKKTVKKQVAQEPRKRVPTGSILAEEEYESPLLEVLREMGGQGSSRDVIEQVGAKLSARLTDLDRDTLRSGSVRWENRIQFVRLKLIDKGLLKKDSPRGIWELA